MSDDSGFLPGLICGALIAGLLVWLWTALIMQDRAVTAYSEGRMVSEITKVRGECHYWLNKNGGVFTYDCEGADE